MVNESKGEAKREIKTFLKLNKIENTTNKNNNNLLENIKIRSKRDIYSSKCLH